MSTNEQDWLRWAARQGEPAPAIDVRQQVLDQLAGPARTPSRAIMATFAAMSSLAATVVAAWTVHQLLIRASQFLPILTDSLAAVP